MISWKISLILLVLSLNGIHASCNETQIDVNSANLTELDRIIGVGSVIAQNIIDSRPFNSLDDLIKVNRIGNITLDKIKQQGLACVNETEENNPDLQEEESSSEEKVNNEEDEDSTRASTSQESFDFNLSNDSLNNLNNNLDEVTISDPIVLSPKDNSKSIKSEENKKILERMPFYGIILLGIIFSILLIVKKRKYRNEFN